MKARGPFPRIALVPLQSWAGVTHHRIELVGQTRDGSRYLAIWRDATSFSGRKKDGDRLRPPVSAVCELGPSGRLELVRKEEGCK